MVTGHLPLRAGAFLVFCWLLRTASAQCANEWLPGFGTPGVMGSVLEMTQWDSDGPGPSPQVVVVVGQFQTAADIIANNVATFDPLTGAWAPLGAGVDGRVQTAVVAPWGELFIGGYFAYSGSVPCGGIARWTGTAWAPVGGGVTSSTAWGVQAILPRSSTEIWVGGDLFNVGGPSGYVSVARWMNGSWSSMSGPAGPVLDLVSMPNGDIVAAGQFQGPGLSIARWNGSSWLPLGSGLGSPYAANDLELLPNGDLLVTGSFYAAGGSLTGAIARWNGAVWSSLGTPPFSTGQSIRRRPNGYLVVGSDGGGMVHEWDGAAWSTLGYGNTAGTGIATRVNAVEILPDSRILVGGAFPFIDGVPTANLAVQGAATWQPVATGFDAEVVGLAPRGNGFAAVGFFLRSPGGVANFVAEWNGTTWQSLGGGTNFWTTKVATLANGDLVASGHFTVAGTTPALHIARWDGTNWHALGQGIGPGQSSPISTLRPLANGNLVVGGSFSVAGGAPAQNLAVWNGAVWQPILGLDGPVRSVLELQNGDWIVGGVFVNAGGVVANGIARWDGTTWSALGSGTDWSVFVLAEMPNGDIVAGGNFSNAGGAPAIRVAKWDGAGWLPMGSGLPFVPTRFLVLPDGDLLAVGSNTSFGGNTVSRWNGTTWLTLGSGDRVLDAVLLPHGELVLAGTMTAPTPTAGRIARLATNCPASVSSYGSSCIGGAGPVILAATSAPWLQSTFRSRATGMPPHSLAVAVYGFSQIAVPLSAGHPQGRPGCLVLVTDQILLQFLVGSGHVDAAVIIPNDAALVGAQFYHQVVPVELDALGSITAITSSNALAATVGVF
jgi:trimeric autotransporter adhesin